MQPARTAWAKFTPATARFSSASRAPSTRYTPPTACSASTPAAWRN